MSIMLGLLLKGIIMNNKVLTFVLGVAIFVVIVVGSIVIGGACMVFIHIPSAVIVAGVAGGLGLVKYNGGGLIVFVDCCKKYCIVAGGVGAMIGALSILQDYKNPENIGSGLALFFLTVLYSLICYCIAEATTAKTLDQKLTGSMNYKIMTFFGLVVLAGLLIGSVAMGTECGGIAFLHIPSAVFLLGGAGGLGLAIYKGGGFVAYIGCCKRFCIPVAMIGTLIGFIQILQNLKDWNDLGIALAIAFMTILYGVICYYAIDAIVSKATD